MTDIAAILEEQASFLHSIASGKHVVPDISPRDMLFDFFVGALAGDNQKAVEAYINSGDDCARKFAGLCAEHVAEQRPNILEFASGYGRVSRYAKQVLPNAEWTCSDVHQEAVDFIAGKLSLASFISPSRPRNWVNDRRFDVVFALSFFSHMPRATFGPWLSKLFEAVAPGGLLIFTTHGAVSLVNMKAVDPNAAFDGAGFYWSATASNAIWTHRNMGQVR